MQARGVCQGQLHVLPFVHQTNVDTEVLHDVQSRVTPGKSGVRAGRPRWLKGPGVDISPRREWSKSPPGRPRHKAVDCVRGSRTCTWVQSVELQMDMLAGAGDGQDTGQQTGSYRRGFCPKTLGGSWEKRTAHMLGRRGEFGFGHTAMEDAHGGPVVSWASGHRLGSTELAVGTGGVRPGVTNCLSWRLSVCLGLEPPRLRTQVANAPQVWAAGRGRDSGAREGGFQFKGRAGVGF
uniref:uncharacterized protein LOC110598926 n=1 Tax=Ictidomys tridecemlineatus TaxID=43179 RepID=UPI001A9E5830|nr:uncharacterized protein LOC110598926 [Ictidomys tridecemlineatus]